MNTPELVDVASDLQLLHLLPASFNPESLELCGVGRIVAATCNIAAETANTADDKQLRSALGKKILDVAASGFEFGSTYLECCLQAEPKLLENIAADSVTDPDRRSPVVVTQHGQPLAIIKTYGEMSCYGLTEDLSKDVLAGVFSEPVVSFCKSDIPYSDTAWELALDDQTYDLFYADKPLRYSTFSLPGAERQAFADQYRVAAYDTVLRTDHQAIVDRAVALLADAQPLVMR